VPDGGYPGSIELAGQQSAATLLYEMLAEAMAMFPETFADVPLAGDVTTFRSTYPIVLPQFEAARLASPQRVEIAGFLAESFGHHLVWQSARGSEPLESYLTESGTPLALQWQEGSGEPGWTPQFDYHGVQWCGAAFSDLGQHLAQRNIITPQAGHALRWLSETLLDDGRVHLTGRKIVMMGASAEMAPVQHWLQAGADVLWLDIRPPSDAWLGASGHAGHLAWPVSGSDLLHTDPRDLVATILAFADGDAVDLGLYAYAPGQARELRLTGCMNAIVRALPAPLIASVTMLVSPTTPTELSAHDCSAMAARWQTRPRSESVLDGLGLLGRGGGSAICQGAAATRTVVGIQGASYQAAQYFGKVVTAEYWARHGIPVSNVTEPLRVSANTAAITRTRSIQHPVFDAAFIGADAFGVETFTPELSRTLNGLLAVHDWTHPERQIPGEIRVHGGIHTLPYPLEATLRAAATWGFIRSPGLVAGLLRR
jgi:hypothetical protein